MSDWLPRAASALAIAWLFLSGGLLAARSVVRAAAPLAPGQLVAAGVALATVAWLMRAAWLYTARSEMRRRVAEGRRQSYRGHYRTAYADRSPVASGGRKPAGDTGSVNASFSTARSIGSAKVSNGAVWAAASPLLATSAGLALWGAALNRGVGSPAAAAIFWLTLCGEEGLAWRRRLAGRHAKLLNGDGASTDAKLLQEFTRLAMDDGEEIIRGRLAISIDAGCRTGAGHVAFCPPFDQRPHFEMRLDAGPAADLKLSQIYPHGARIEAKLPQAAAANTVVLMQFFAQARRSMATP